MKVLEQGRNPVRDEGQKDDFSSCVNTYCLRSLGDIVIYKKGYVFSLLVPGTEVLRTLEFPKW